ncbi:MAG: hypothetical protein COS99_07270 [Candidatus Omnitrophica bacterium CG07_land_8_20_14_0_80_42_15]|uniref:Metal-dependent hydrolase n=1 Tax=Candidatus Aquitaenariimonas noxiae TaxID=1974741 RepID=A0A2J0KXI4_9BACT|nr:MAG: hypothetical protein COS99_07270 [Candidatus Omnitrophica bacterium CG07_land_8_20_14_0_80_42_15]
MLVRDHLIASGVISGIWYYFTKSVPESLVFFLSGFIIDVDHFVDYYISHPFTLKYKKIRAACLTMDQKEVYILLHSFELVILAVIIGAIFFPERIYFVAVLGVVQHLMLDQVSNDTYPFSYFLIYRFLKGFRKESVFKSSRCKGFFPIKKQ